MSMLDLLDRLQKYLQLRKALGFPMRVEERLLRSFVQYTQIQAPAVGLPAQVAVDWACQVASGCTAGTQKRRLSVARGFLTYLHASVSTVEVPSAGLLATMRRPHPHIYAENEIVGLMNAALGLGPKDSLRPFTYNTLIGFVASCGLRASEAIRLESADVFLDEEIPRICIQKTKFGKSRLAPIHSTTAEALRSYAIQRKALGYDGFCKAFFVSEKGTPLNYQVVARTFVELARSLALRGPVGHRGASLHGLRHTFAVSRMRAWYREGLDVKPLLPELSVYMGHVCINATYWYLTATPELLGSAASKFESFCESGGVR